VNVEGWLTRLKVVDWSLIWPDDVKAVVSELKALVDPDLHEKIDRAVVKARTGEDGTKEIFIILEGNKETGEQLVFEIMCGPMDSPDHIHGQSPDVDYGEMYWTLAGEISDVTDDGHPFVHKRWMPPVTHGPSTRHKPRVVHWWLGVFYHPCASRLAAA